MRLVEKCRASVFLLFNRSSGISWDECFSWAYKILQNHPRMAKLGNLFNKDSINLALPWRLKLSETSLIGWELFPITAVVHGPSRFLRRGCGVGCIWSSPEPKLHHHVVLKDRLLENAINTAKWTLETSLADAVYDHAFISYVPLSPTHHHIFGWREYHLT